MENKIIQLHDETDLHKKVIEFIRKFEPHAFIIPWLGEHQFNSIIRINCFEKRYLGGHPDILIINAHRYHQWLTLESKTPTGKTRISGKQIEYLCRLEQTRLKYIVSND